ncbi:glutamate synthase-related protein [Clostridium hydrogeniformans]|uniref:glutamate synthase-related protein n=1 Tax=Clostridium hydrogeniformans TaxID=349933 RepID=UPI0004863860|nr:glutamate synthase-related protein [Clostridium hydrogeniformans]
MESYKCKVCGYIHKGETPPEECPVCKQPASAFEKITDSKEINKKEDENIKVYKGENNLSYLKEYERSDKSSRYMDEIHQMAVTGKQIIGSMGTKMYIPNWDDILILGNQLNPPPLDEFAEVDTVTIIGKNAKKPMRLENPVYISHMSFGALSKETKIALAKGSAMAKTAMCSGEGGILPEEMNTSYKYIFEYVPNLYSVTKENLQNSDAIEIKIGQGSKPGMGGLLPAEKVTKEIAEIRNKPMGQDVISPSKFDSINSKEDLKELVSKLRDESGGRPIGIKVAACKIESDMEYCVFAEPDFITIDGRGGATAASPQIIRDATSVPTIYALYRARKYLDSVKSDIQLIITGGLRVSSDFAKALAMGADAVAIASSALMAAACQQYRICGTGLCPVGIATQDPELRKRLNVEAGAKRVANFLNVSLEELKTFGRITGHSKIHDICIDDLCTINREISEFTNIRHT